MDVHSETRETIQMTLPLRLFLFVLGGLVGMVVWALLGIGAAELGILPHFDPLGVVEEPPPPTIAVQMAEWSLPVFVLLGAWLMPPLIGWLTKPPDDLAPS